MGVSVGRSVGVEDAVTDGVSDGGWVSDGDASGVGEFSAISENLVCV